MRCALKIRFFSCVDHVEGMLAFSVAEREIKMLSGERSSGSSETQTHAFGSDTWCLDGAKSRMSAGARAREETRVAGAVMGDEIACCAPSITDLGSRRARSSGSAGCASGLGIRTAVPACRAPMCAALSAGLPVSGVISERVQAERGCTADLTVVRDRHCNRGERASQYSRFALGDEEHQEGAPAPTRSRGGARVAGLGVLAGPELPQRSGCSATACTLF
jgi:hypothetical protein